MAFGLYIHIPYCLQKCHYCDFTTFNLDHKISMHEYTQLLLTELRERAANISEKNLTSVYFGGGTPSLLPAEDILAIRREIANVGFQLSRDTEITIEINPGTINDEKLDLYLAAGVNRFSVGVQTFNDAYLKRCGREHSADDSRKTLLFLKKHNLNYSFDLLFGLPEQGLAELQRDLDELLSYSPTHVSLYNLTVPQNHGMNAGRAADEEQAEMFGLIDANLRKSGIERYELSNFSKPGSESRHNCLYWSDRGYWGLGVSAHSYLPKSGPWGTRFWNATSANAYKIQTQSLKNFSDLPDTQVERLSLHESLTDYCHTHMRVLRGLKRESFFEKFGQNATFLLENRMKELVESGLVRTTEDGYKFSPQGLPLANQVFLKLTFSREEVSTSAR